MNEFLNRDLGSTLLSIAVLVGWLLIGFVFLRLITLSIKRVIESLTKTRNK